MLLRRKVGLLEGLRQALAPSYYPLCDICRKHCDSVSIVDMRGTMADVLVRCHGAEQLTTVDLGSSEYDETDVAKAVRSVVWFEPKL